MSNGEWIELIHKCKTPTAQEIETKEAQVGSIWQCASENPKCNDQWKLRQIKAEPGIRLVHEQLPKWDRLTVNGEPIPDTTAPSRRQQ